MFRTANRLLAGFIKPTAPLFMLKPTQPMQMLKPSPALLAKPKDTEAVTKKGRRLAPQSASHLGRGFMRQKVWQYRFVETGGDYDRVWLALGGKMKRRRVGRPKNIKDNRYYWRPIERGHQRTYQRRLRINSRSNSAVKPLLLHAPNSEIGKANSGPLAQFQHLRHRFKGSSPPARQDFEFRVF